MAVKWSQLGGTAGMRGRSQTLMGAELKHALGTQQV